LAAKANSTEMMSEPESKGISKATIVCLADVSLKYGDKKDLQRYIKGSIKSEQVKGLRPSNKPYWDAAEKCVT
jgi:hypothetical protein